MRAHCDPDSDGPVGLRLASTCGRALSPSQGRGVKITDGHWSPIAGYVEPPFEMEGIKRDLNVAIMPELDADCYLGVNFVREF